MSRTEPTDPIPTRTWLGRHHVYSAPRDGDPLELEAVSPGCDCADCKRLTFQLRSRR